MEPTPPESPATGPTPGDPDRGPALWAGAVFGVMTGGSFLAGSGGRLWWAALLVALGFFVLMGSATYLGRRWRRRAAVRALGPVGETLDNAAIRDAVSGPPAEDPAGRAEQLRILDFQIAQTRRAGRRSTVIFVLLLAGEVVLAVTSSAWFWWAAALFLVFLMLTPWQLARLGRRRKALAAAR